MVNLVAKLDLSADFLLQTCQDLEARGCYLFTMTNERGDPMVHALNTTTESLSGSPP